MRPATTKKPLEFSAVYDAWFDGVVRFVRACGGPEAELEDLAQEVFLVVQRKLADFDGDNVPGWLFAITRRTVSDHRRRAWFRRMFLRPRDVELDAMPSLQRSPAESLEQKEASQLLEELLAKMSEKRRTALWLFEVEGYSADEIAALEGVPAVTVRTRLFHARKDFLQRWAKREPRESA